MLFQIGFGGTYLWKEAMGNIQVGTTKGFRRRTNSASLMFLLLGFRLTSLS